jgi:hypothetical protein
MRWLGDGPNMSVPPRDFLNSLLKKELAPAANTTCVFRVSAFTDDVAKTNLAAILNQYMAQRTCAAVRSGGRKLSNAACSCHEKYL